MDMEKAYDHVNWGYVDWVLDQMGFGGKWRNWMKICISSPSFSILVNGCPKVFSKAGKVTRHLLIRGGHGSGSSQARPYNYSSGLGRGLGP